MDIDLDFKAFLRRHPRLRPLRLVVSLLRCDQPDRNGNVYPRAVMERAIVGWQGTGRVEGEPNNLSHVAFVVNDLHMVDDEVWAKFKSLETLAGLRLRQLIELGGRVDFGIEGTGSTVAGVAQPNFHLTGVVAYWQPPPLPPP